MSLAPGSRIGAYEVLSPLGAGGMGEVYRARDTTLKRDVALKVLPPDVEGDPERLARFEREAEVLAQLNHPHIAQVYGFEKVFSGGDEQRALVMELVEGEDLSRVIDRGPPPLPEALSIARQIAEALEAAHEAGIIHRDLKPANIKVRHDGTVKVLDFGLAKALDHGATAAASHSLAHSPTITSPAMTLRGVILGTAAYMAPEQARGKAVDRRADIWAFGCVLYEMLCGRRAFDGEELTDVLARVIEREPDWSRLPPAVSGRLRRLLERLLAKDRGKRFHHMGDVRCEIDEILHAPPVPETTPTAAGWRGRAAGYAGAAAFGAAVMLVVSLASPTAPPRAERVLRFDIPLPFTARGQARLSPDGRHLAYNRVIGGVAELWLRGLGSGEPVRLGSIESGSLLIWSADGTSVFSSESKSLRRFDVAAGTTVPQPVTEPLRAVDVNPLIGQVMLADGRVIVGAGAYSADATLQTWTPTGRSSLLPLDTERDEVRQALPAAAGADRVTYASYRADGSVHLCVTPVSAPRARCAGLLNQSSQVHYRNGRIVFIRGGTVLTRPFDLERVAFDGEEHMLVDEEQGGMLSGILGLVQLDVTEDGILGFVSGGGGERLVWQSPGGLETAIRDVAATTTLALSPDGRRVLSNLSGSLLLMDFARGTTSQLGSSAGDAIWAPDGERLAHRTQAGIVVRSVADARERVVLPGATVGFPEDWSPDGRWIAIGLRGGEFQAALVPAAGGDLVPFLERDGPLARADEFHFSPDGRWLAFNADSGGRPEVFVVPVPPTGVRWQVSASGGVQARWHPGRQTLYYLALDGTMMAVEVTSRPAFSASAPKPLFDTGLSPAAGFDEYRVAPDGRFLLKKPREQLTYRVIVNWPGLLEARAAGR